jgi:hypothetical protein
VSKKAGSSKAQGSNSKGRMRRMIGITNQTDDHQFIVAEAVAFLPTEWHLQNTF